MWPIRIAFARFRPIGVGVAVKIAIVAALFLAFVALDYRVFRRLFAEAAKIEALTPFFALGLIENFIGLVFFIAIFVLFSSSLTSAIGAFFADLDLETYHSAPVSRVRLIVARWAKSFIQSSYVVVAFIAPMFAALAAQYEKGVAFVLGAMGGLLLLLAVPVSLAGTVIILLVRFFPVRRVHQVAATFAILFMSLAVVAMRMSRPERLFADVKTDEVMAVLEAIELPSRELYPSSWLAAMVISTAQGASAMKPSLQLVALAAGSFILFLAVARALYFRSFVRARESSSPTAIGSAQVTSWLDRWTRRLEPQVRAMVGKEVRVVSRDAAQWSQLFMMIALLFLYLYNIQMIPLKGDARAAVLAYLNLGMAGFVIGAICLRFAYPSLTSEGKQFWILASAPISFRRLLWVKAVVYSVPLLGLGVLLTALANFMYWENYDVRVRMDGKIDRIVLEDIRKNRRSAR